MPDPKQIIAQAKADGKPPEFLAELRSQMGVVDEAINLPRNVELKSNRNSLVAKMKKDKVSPEYQKAILKKYDVDNNYAKNDAELKKQEDYKESIRLLMSVRPDLEAPREKTEEDARLEGDIQSTNNIYEKGLSAGELEVKEQRAQDQERFSIGGASANESAMNTITNTIGNFATVDDRLAYAGGLLLKKFGGDHLGDKLIGHAETELTKQEQLRNKPTIGFTDIDKYEGRNLGAVGAAAGFNATMGFISSAIENAVPGLLWADITASTIRDVNKAKAEELGVSVEQLIETGESEVMLPLAASGVMFFLEKSGIDAATGKGTSAALKNMAPGAIRELGKLIQAGTTEGVTEWLQGAVEQYTNEVGAKGYSVDALVKAAEWLVSKEGRETFYQGAFGGKVARIPSTYKEFTHDRRTQVDKDAIEQSNKDIAQLEGMRNNPNITDEELESINAAFTEAQKKRNDAVVNPYKDLINVNEGGIKQMKAINDEVVKVAQEMLFIEQSPTMSKQEKDMLLKTLKEKDSALRAEANTIVALANLAKEEADKTIIDRVRQVFKDKKKEENKTKEGQAPKKPNTWKQKQEEEALVEKEQLKLEKEQQDKLDDPITDFANKTSPAQQVKDTVVEANKVEQAEQTVEESTVALVELGDKLQRGEITQEQYKEQSDQLFKDRKKAQDVFTDRKGQRKENLFNEDGTLNEKAYKDSKSLEGERKQFYEPFETIADPKNADKTFGKLATRITKAFKGVKVQVNSDPNARGFGHYDPNTKTIVVNKNRTKGNVAVSLDTLFHENGHVFFDFLKDTNPKLLEEVYSLVEKNADFKKFLEDAKDPKHPYSAKNLGVQAEGEHARAIAEEFFSRMLGRKGTEFVQQNPNLSKSTKQKLLDKLKQIWDSLAKKLGIRDRTGTIEQLAERVIAKLVTGEEIGTVQQDKFAKTRYSEALDSKLDPLHEQAIRLLGSTRPSPHLNEQTQTRLGKNWDTFKKENLKNFKKNYNLKQGKLQKAIKRHAEMKDQLKKSFRRDPKLENWVNDLKLDIEAHKRMGTAIPVEVIRQLRQADYEHQTIAEFDIAQTIDGEEFSKTFVVLDPDTGKVITVMLDARIHGYELKKLFSLPLNETESAFVNKSIEGVESRTFAPTVTYEHKPLTEVTIKNKEAATEAEQKIAHDTVLKALEAEMKILSKKSGKAKSTNFFSKSPTEILGGFISAFKDVQGGENSSNLLIRAGSSIIEQKAIDENLSEEEQEKLKEEQLKTNGVIGNIVLSELIKLNILDLDTGYKNKDPYTVTVKNEAKWDALLRSFDHIQTVKISPETKAYFEVPPLFKNFVNPMGLKLFSKAHKSVKNVAAKVLETVNNAISTPLASDFQLLATYQNMIDKIKPENKSKLRLFENILRTAQEVADKPFFSLYRLDFRGRIYPTVSYLTHQGTDMAKSLMRLGKKSPLGEGGWKWLMIQAADTYGYDGGPLLADRMQWVDENLEELMAIAADPVANYDAWKDLEEPFLFVATVTEMKRAIDSGDIKNFQSNMPIHMDATTSGPQIMAAITRDLGAGQMLNLLDSSERGDLYTAVAEKVIDWIGNPTPQEISMAAEFDAKVKKLKAAIENTTDKEEWKLANDAFYDLVGNKENQALKELSTRVFMSKIPRDKFRKIMKGPVMTKYYSAGEKTVARQLLKKFEGEPGFEGFDYTYAFEVSKKVFTELDDLLKGPGQLMKMIARIGQELAKKGKPMRFTLPVNDFVMHQEPKVRKEGDFRIPYVGTNKNVLRKNKSGVLKQVFNYSDTDKIDSSKAMSSAAPNFIHAIDAQIPAWLYLKFKEAGVLTIHDSFGTSAGNSEALYGAIRQAFKEITFDNDLIKDFLYENFDEATAKKKNAKVKRGKLTGDGVLKNEFAFSAGKGIKSKKQLSAEQKFKEADKLSKEAQQFDLQTKIDTILEESKDC